MNKVYIPTFNAALPGDRADVTQRTCLAKGTTAQSQKFNADRLVRWVLGQLTERNVAFAGPLEISGELNRPGLRPDEVEDKELLISVQGVDICRVLQTYEMDYPQGASSVVEVGIAITLFGVNILGCYATDGESDLLTANGFYQLLENEMLSAVIATAIHNAKQTLYTTLTGEYDELGAEGGPAYQFADWVLGKRGDGEEFKLKA